MKIVGLEEHIAMPQLLDAWSRVPGTPRSRSSVMATHR